MKPPPIPLADAYRRMRDALGHQDWWPGDGAFEVCVGAILTQNTSWTNVERALARLGSDRLLSPAALHALPETQLADLLRPAGTFRVKARRLRAFLDVLVNEYHGSLDRLFHGDTVAVRNRLLAIPGIGPETADCMLLYAGGHPRFVVDAYTRRIFARHAWCSPSATYDDIQALCMNSFAQVPGNDLLDAWQDCHAQLVAVAKRWCRARTPDCPSCPLRPLLPPGSPPP